MAISLVKGQKISLEKSGGGTLQNICVGLNWGAIDGKGFFGGKKKVAVDLDASCAMFDANGQVLDVIYFGNLKSKDGSIIHSGDDVTGDVDGDDGLDNEVIVVNLPKIPASTDKIVFVLNSFKGQDFATVPFAAIRIYEGSPEVVNNVLAKYDIARDSKFSGSVSMVMGRFYRHNGAWKFVALGEPTQDKKLEETINTVQQKFLN
jgi:tellurium resistance protein TerZ